MASDLAAHVRRRSRVTGVASTEQLVAMIRDEGCILDPDQQFEAELLGSYTKVGGRGHIAVRAGLPERDRRWVLAHELAHALLDEGNQLLLLSRRDVRARQQERKADLVAGWLVFGQSILHGDSLSVDELADCAELPRDFVHRWWELAEWEILATLASRRARAGPRHSRRAPRLRGSEQRTLRPPPGAGLSVREPLNP